MSQLYPAESSGNNNLVSPEDPQLPAVQGGGARHLVGLNAGQWAVLLVLSFGFLTLVACVWNSAGSVGTTELLGTITALATLIAAVVGVSVLKAKK